MSARAPRSPRSPRDGGSGVLRALLDLSAAQQRTAAAALVVLVSLATPWYAKEVVFPAAAGRPPAISRSTLSGFGAFSFVEAAVLLVAVAVLALVWARATGRSFSLPAGDGTVVTIAAAWIGLLVVYRLFDRPEGSASGTSATLIGLSWGIFASLAAVGLLLATGLDVRRREAAGREGPAAPPEGPVVDPRDVVAPGTGGGRSAARGGASGPREHGRGEPGPVREGRAVREPGRPEWPGPRGASGAGASSGPREARSWSWDDPEGPGPEPDRSAPWPRRPSPPDEATRALGREDAAAQLRDFGVGPDASLGRGGGAGPRRDDPVGDEATRVTRHEGSPGDDEATRLTSPDDATRVASAGGRADDATRVRPAGGTDEVLPGDEDRPRRGRRRRG